MNPIIDHDNPFWVGPAPQPRIPVHLPRLRPGSEGHEPRRSPLASRLTATASIAEYRANQKTKEDKHLGLVVRGKEEKSEKQWRKGRPSLDPESNPFLNSENPFLASSSSSSGRGSLIFGANATTATAGHVQMEVGSGSGTTWTKPISAGNEEDGSPSESEVSKVLGFSAGTGTGTVALTGDDDEEEEEEVKLSKVELDRSDADYAASASTSISTSVWVNPGRHVPVQPEFAQEEDVKPVIPALRGRKRNSASASTTTTTLTTTVDGPKAKKPRASRAKKVKVEDVALGDEIPTAVKTETKKAVSSARASTSTSTFLSEVPVNVDVKPLDVDLKGKGKGKAKAKAAVPISASEVRQGRWRKKCPVATRERLGRVMEQRMFMLDRSSRPEGALCETFKVLGSTGNVYTIKIGSQPTCDCPDAGKGNIPCKHIIFVFIKVLKLPSSSELWYQKGLLDSELRAIFDTSPPVAQGSYQVPRLARAAWLKASGREDEIPESDREEVEESSESALQGATPPPKGRKEAVGDDCPICYEEMTEDDVKRNELVWDDSEFGCGKALHVECFRNWTTSLVSRGSEVTCVYCRCAWPQASDVRAGQTSKGPGVQYNSGGYMNIAELAGVNRKRDTSSYYQGPIRGRAMWEPRYEDD